MPCENTLGIRWLSGSFRSSKLPRDALDHLQMKSLRVLLVFTDPPLPFGGAAARWFYVLLKGLVERGHRVTAFTPCSKPEEIEKSCVIFYVTCSDILFFHLP